MNPVEFCGKTLWMCAIDENKLKWIFLIDFKLID